MFSNQSFGKELDALEINFYNKKDVTEGSVIPPVEKNYLLLEDGSYYLLENGGRILLES